MTAQEIKDLHIMLNECSMIFASSETPAAKLNALAMEIGCIRNYVDNAEVFPDYIQTCSMD